MVEVTCKKCGRKFPAVDYCYTLCTQCEDNEFLSAAGYKIKSSCRYKKFGRHKWII